MAKAWDFAARETLRRMALDGATIWEIAQKLGHADEAVKAQARNMGVTVRLII